MSLDPFGASTDNSAAQFNGRALIGFNGTTQNAVVQGVAGKGIEFNVNASTFGSGQAAVITSAGNFGISTTSPTTKLTVGVANQANLNDGLLVQRSAGGSHGVSFGLRSDASGNYRGAIGALSSTGVDTEALSISLIGAAIGNVGIGTTTPNAKLTVTASGSNGINLDADTSNGNVSGRLFFSTATVGQSTALLNTIGNLGFYTGGTPNSTAGTQRLTLTSAGNFGIGTSSPWGKLSINNSTADAGGQPLFVIASSTVSATTTQFIIDNQGRVGIGTTSPTYVLDVAGSGASNPIARFSQVSAGSGSPILSLARQGHASQNNQWDFNITTNTGIANASLLISPSSNAIGGATADFGVSGVTNGLGSPQFIIKGATGNVGIASTSPTALLSVGGSGQLAAIGDGGSASTAYISISSFGGVSGRQMLGFNANTGNAVVQSSATRGIDFNVNNSTFGSGQAMVITSAGLVGIGTTTPLPQARYSSRQLQRHPPGEHHPEHKLLPDY